jgi:hypothetical protein
MTMSTRSKSEQDTHEKRTVDTEATNTAQPTPQDNVRNTTSRQEDTKRNKYWTPEIDTRSQARLGLTVEEAEHLADMATVARSKAEMMEELRLIEARVQENLDSQANLGSQEEEENHKGDSRMEVMESLLNESSLGVKEGNHLDKMEAIDRLMSRILADELQPGIEKTSKTRMRRQANFTRRL